MLSDDWPPSRICRLLRPLKLKCHTLAAHSQRAGNALNRLDTPPRLGLRIHLRKDAIRTLDFSKKIHAVRDCYSDIVLRVMSDKLHPQSSDNPALPSLTTLCSVIIGAHMTVDGVSPDQQDFNETDDLYQFMPSMYRPRALLMQALHLILDICPPHASLYHVLLDVTMRNKLYPESEVLVDAALELACETSRGRPPPLSYPTHKRFLADIYRRWVHHFPPANYVRLVSNALKRASSTVVWTSKATKRLARKLAYVDISLLSPLITSLIEIVVRRKRGKGHSENNVDSNELEIQTQEWLEMGLELCTLSLKKPSSQLSCQHSTWVEDIVDCCRVFLSSKRAVSYQFIGTVACIYTLRLVNGPDSLDSNDYLDVYFQNIDCPPSTYAPFCQGIFKTKSIAECADILGIISSTLHIHTLQNLRATLWSSVLDCIEDPEVEQILLEKSDSSEFRRFRLGVINNVEEAERNCFTVNQPRRNSVELTVAAGDIDTTQWEWEPSIDCWFRKARAENSDQQGPSKRRRIDRSSYLDFVATPSRSPCALRSKAGTSRKYHDDRDVGRRRTLLRSPATRQLRKPRSSLNFTSLLTSALSHRRDLHNSRGKYIQNPGDVFDEALSDSDESDPSNEDSHSEDIHQLHALSEDSLDLFQVTNTSSPSRY